MTELNSIDDAFHLSDYRNCRLFFQSGRFPTTEEYIKWDLWSKAFYLKVHSSCGNKPPLSYQSLGQQQEVTLTDRISSEEEEEEEEEPLTDGTSSNEVFKRDRASNKVESYDPMRKPMYDMSGYTPVSSFTGPHSEFEYDEQTRL
ncbi:hypothetical protein Hanom_Chr04g00368801 [Helianthus anomalus]